MPHISGLRPDSPQSPARQKAALLHKQAGGKPGCQLAKCQYPFNGGAGKGRGRGKNFVRDMGKDKACAPLVGQQQNPVSICQQGFCNAIAGIMTACPACGQTKIF